MTLHVYMFNKATIFSRNRLNKIAAKIQTLLILKTPRDKDKPEKHF